MPDEAELDESSDVLSENEYEAKEEQEHDEETMAEHGGKRQGQSGADGKKPKVDARDPSRAKRKKARRACFACQRAHLTCGMSLLVIL